VADLQLVNPHLEGDSFFWEGGPDGVLLLHGFTATTAEVRPLARFLYGRAYTVAGPLLPGHGTQPADLNRVAWRDWTRAAEEAYRGLAARCRRVIIGGESMGGLLTLYLGSEHSEAAALLCYAPALRIPVTVFDRLKLHLGSWFVPYVASAPGPRTEADDLWQGYPVKPLRGVLQLLRLQAEVRSRLAGITQPLLVVQGRLDRTIEPEGAQTLHDSVRSARKELHWMANSSHCVILDGEREPIFELTGRFLDRTLSGI